MQIHPMQKSDIKKVLMIAQECGLSHWSEKAYSRETDREDSLSLVAKDKHLVLGFITARIVAASEMEILNFGVGTEFRRTGIGSFLWSSLQAEARRKSVAAIWLEVRCANVGAIKFYLAQGFEKIQVRKNFYTQPADNALLMRFNPTVPVS